ncbi:hypothetical protein [Halorussus caseinilyticus]|uniref:Uncharacterized protein n=1 Tax=Halorussus caseinilyticus TaxID=3034025 RepID=A0ABD5WH41_9EURY
MVAQTTTGLRPASGRPLSSTQTAGWSVERVLLVGRSSASCWLVGRARPAGWSVERVLPVGRPGARQAQTRLPRAKATSTFL